MESKLGSKKPVTKYIAKNLYFNAFKEALEMYIEDPESIELHRESSGKVNFESHNVFSSTPVMFLRDYGKSVKVTLLLSFTPNDQNDYLINPNCKFFQDYIFNARLDWNNDLIKIYEPCLMTGISEKPFVCLEFESEQFHKAFKNLKISRSDKQNEFFKQWMIFFVVKYLKRAKPSDDFGVYDDLKNPLAYNWRTKLACYFIDRKEKTRIKEEKMREQKKKNEPNFK